MGTGDGLLPLVLIPLGSYHRQPRKKKTPPPYTDNVFIEPKKRLALDRPSLSVIDRRTVQNQNLTASNALDSIHAQINDKDPQINMYNFVAYGKEE